MKRAPWTSAKERDWEFQSTKEKPLNFGNSTIQMPTSMGGESEIGLTTYEEEQLGFYAKERLKGWNSCC